MSEYIDREALMKNFCKYDLTKCVKYGNKDADQCHNSYSTMMMYEIADEIIDAPAADVAPVVHGLWINKTTFNKGISFYRFVCSACGHNFWNAGIDNFNYCPNCGAKMDGEDHG